MDAEPSRRKRRWFQFSLRTLLIVTAIVAIPCALLGRKLEQKRRERAAFKALEKLGGWPYYATMPDGEPIGPPWLRQLLGDDFFSDVVAVELPVGRIDDAGLSILNDLPHVEVLNLSEQDISDVGIARLNVSSDLKSLVLSDTKITDASLAKFKSLTHLEVLNLERTNVTDAGLADLQRALPNCQINQ